MAAWSDWLAGPEHTDALAQRWAALLARHATQAPQARVALALDGELGAGKSHFSRALLRACGVDGPIPSPTYSLLELYPQARPPAAHMDWYRLADPLELEMLDWVELRAEQPLLLVEWAARLPELAGAFDLALRFAPEGAGRRCEIHASSPTGEHLLRLFEVMNEKSGADL